MAERKIVFRKYPISLDKKMVYIKRNPATDLVTAINNKRGELEEGGEKDKIEVFHQDDNILITEIGYIVAVYDL